MIGNKNPRIPEQNMDMTAYLDMVFSANGADIMTRARIEAMGWKLTPDRGMSENNGFTFYGPKNYMLRYWTIAPRIELSKFGDVIFDSALADPDNFGPGKQLTMSVLKDQMVKYAIL